MYLDRQAKPITYSPQSLESAMSWGARLSLVRTSLVVCPGDLSTRAYGAPSLFRWSARSKIDLEITGVTSEQRPSAPFCVHGQRVQKVAMPHLQIHVRE